MALTVIQRPEKTLDNGFISRWNSSELPLKYTFSSDLYPVNNIDTPLNITNGVYVNAQKGYELTIGANSFVNLDSIKITGTNTSLDGGVFSIKSTTVTTIVIDYFTTETTSTGSLIKYYNNYNGTVKVFAGAKDGHPYNTDSSKPFNLIGEISVDFKTNNEGIIDLKSYIKPDITADFDADNQNSHFAWSTFHIQYSESYDFSDGTKITTYNSPFEDDKLGACVPFTGYLNSDFSNGLASWSQQTITNGGISYGGSWLGNVQNTATVTVSSNNPNIGVYSDILYQSITVLGNINYSFEFEIDFIGTANSLNCRVVDILGNTLGSRTVYGAGTYVINVLTNNDVTSLGFACGGVAFGSSADVTMNTFQADTIIQEPCFIYANAIYGVKQFQDSLGGNFGDYVLNTVDDDVTPKILTHFEELRNFKGVDFYVNALIPESTFSLSEDADNVFLEINLFDRTGESVLSTNYKVNNQGDGVYTITPNIDDSLGWEYGYCRFIIIPGNTFVDADFGTFENNSLTGITILPNSGGANQICNGISVAGFGFQSLHSGRPSLSAPNGMNETNKLYSILKNDTSMNVVEGRTYVISSKISLESGNIDPRHFSNGFIYWLPTNYISQNIVTATPYQILESSAYTTAEPIDSDWLTTTTIFTATATETITLTLFELLKTDIPNNTGGDFNIDDITFKGPIDYISEQKKINNSAGCSYANILRWKNNLGGWEIWDFQNKKQESEIVSNKINIKRDVTQDWDNYFINGETENDTIKNDVSRIVTFNSQILSNNEYKVLQAIKRSVRVQMLQESGKWQTVTIKGSTYEVINDDEKIKELSVTFNLPSTKTQEQ
jgi:hypothetical protein